MEGPFRPWQLLRHFVFRVKVNEVIASGRGLDMYQDRSTADFTILGVLLVVVDQFQQQRDWLSAVRAVARVLLQGIQSR